MSAGAAEAGRLSPAIQRREIPLSPREGIALGLLVAAALAVRCVRWWQTALMFNDGPTFLALAQQMGLGRWSEALSHAYHPLYPLLVWMAHFAVPDWERAAVAVSIVSGALAVLFLFVFLRSAFGRREAWLGAALLAVQPRVVSASADVQSDGLYLALFLGALALVWFALRRERWTFAAAAGLCTGLAYLTRPEGLGVALVASAAIALRMLRGDLGLRRAAGLAGALWVAFALVATPYIGAMRAASGEWRLTGKKPVSGLLAIEDRAQPVHEAQPRALAAQDTAQPRAPTAPSPSLAELASSRLPRLGELLSRLGWTVLAAMRPWFLAVLLLGVASRLGWPGRAGEFVLLVVSLYVVVALAQLRYAGYLDHRHILPALVVTFGYFAPGIDALARGAWRLLARGAAPLPAWPSGLLACVALAAGLGQALAPARSDAQAERAVAEWLRANAAGEGAVAAPKLRLAYYADRPGVVLYHAPAQGQLAWLRAQGARFVILDDGDLKKFPELGAARGAGLRLIHCVARREHWTAAYELDGSGDGAAAVSRTDPACAAAASAVAIGAAVARPSGAD